MKIFALRENFDRRKDKDLLDIAYLSILNEMDYDQDVQPLCHQYGSDELSDIIQQEIRRLSS